jgi:hypothetical protein
MRQFSDASIRSPPVARRTLARHSSSALALSADQTSSASIARCEFGLVDTQLLRVRKSGGTKLTVKTIPRSMLRSQPDLLDLSQILSALDAPAGSQNGRRPMSRLRCAAFPLAFVQIRS